MTADISVDKSVSVSVPVSVSVFVGLVAEASIDVSVGDRGFAVIASVEMAVQIALDPAVAISSKKECLVPCEYYCRVIPWMPVECPWNS